MTTPDLKKLAPDCGDNSCLFGGRGKGGMRTNGGCRCLRDVKPETRRYFQRLEHDYTLLQQEVETLRTKLARQMTEEEASEKALALLNLLESDFGQSGRDVRLLAIRDELMMAARHEEAAPQEGHPNTESCGFDRNASLTEDTYVCTCGYRGETKP